MHNNSLMYVNPLEHIQQQLFWYGYYEKEAILTWEAFIQPGDTVLDIGANAGYYSLVAAPKAKLVYAFEPATSIRQLLEKNVSLNKFDNIRVQAVAISNEAGKATLYLSSEDNIGMAGLRPAENFSGNTEIVNTITLDEWIASQDIKKIALIKIDAEGTEMNILAGMRTILEEHKPAIFMEVIAELLGKFDQSPSAIFKLLLSTGYTAYEPVISCVLKPLHKPKEADIVIFLPAGYKIPANVSLLT